MPLNFFNFIGFPLSFPLLLFLQAALLSDGSIVKTLPGFPGVLPFKLETGYVRVEESELFYYFVESQGRAPFDPLILYLNGGPSCSGLNGFLYQAGPLVFNITDYTGGLPALSLNPNSWTKTASIIFVDAPIGTGFSYATTPQGYSVSDTKSARQTHNFIREWLIDHPEFIKNEFFIASDAYSGIVTPVIAEEILNGNEIGVEPRINLKGFLSGSPHTDKLQEDNSIIPYSYQMALISDHLYQSARISCNEQYVIVDPSNAKCLTDLEAIYECIGQIDFANILEPRCDINLVPEEKDGQQARRSLKENQTYNFNSSVQKTDKKFWCRNFVYALSNIWANDRSVQNALHVRQGTIREWIRCNDSIIQQTYLYDIRSAIVYQKNLTNTGLQVLLYNGDHDLGLPHISTEKWIKSLNLSIQSEWRPWFVDGQIAGYTVKYSNQGYHLTYVTVKGAGHSPTEYKSKECYSMFERWIHYYPL
ncbi:hypothetical protein FEM48_Zijuj09G0192100 [Ziziphus jujuba var. spinosa]|uniref:Serine carboxypeptidase-like 18 n=1 Tax=Ziziphus jujuba var. spinosa TaxID=714518 RepID=A0A978UUT6_ZIZJJ|nr:hypothetical protein FEM48_Zijuj09G0192100 [Ziziphus jujuba var. spinosa]